MLNIRATEQEDGSVGSEIEILWATTLPQRPICRVTSPDITSPWDLQLLPNTADTTRMTASLSPPPTLTNTWRNNTGLIALRGNINPSILHLWSPGVFSPPVLIRKPATFLTWSLESSDLMLTWSSPYSWDPPWLSSKARLVSSPTPPGSLT